MLALCGTGSCVLAFLSSSFAQSISCRSQAAAFENNQLSALPPSNWDPKNCVDCNQLFNNPANPFGASNKE